jgi:hypothetical protein
MSGQGVQRLATVQEGCMEPVTVVMAEAAAEHPPCRILAALSIILSSISSRRIP